MPQMSGLRTANACHWQRCHRHCCLLGQCPWRPLLQLLHKPQHCLPQSHCCCSATAQAAGHAALGADRRHSGSKGLPQMLSHPACACCVPGVSACCCQLQTSSPCADDISAAEAEAQTILPFCQLRDTGQHNPVANTTLRRPCLATCVQCRCMHEGQRAIRSTNAMSA